MKLIIEILDKLTKPKNLVKSSKGFYFVPINDEKVYDISGFSGIGHFDDYTYINDEKVYEILGFSGVGHFEAYTYIYEEYKRTKWGRWVPTKSIMSSNFPLGEDYE